MTGVPGHERTWTAAAHGTTLTVEAPETIRNGEFFEMRISATSDGPFSQVAVGIDRALLADMTVNTMIPAATDEESAGKRELGQMTPFELIVLMVIGDLGSPTRIRSARGLR